MFNPKDIDSVFKVGQRVEVTWEEDKYYGIQGYVTKTGNKECEIMMQSNQTMWFGDNHLTLISTKAK